MKTMKTVFLFTALTIISTAVIASGNLKVNMSQAESERAVVEAVNNQTELFKIEVQNEFGESIFKKETEARADYKRKYDFSALEDGVYYLNVKHGKAHYQKRFQLESGEVEILNERKVLEPFFVQKGDKVKMSYLNYPMDDMSIFVYDDNRLLHEEELENEFTIHKSIDMSELRPGTYRVVFASGFDIFEHDVTVE
jgi:hypothetical protein